MLLTIVAFVVALGLLITIHEYGHYRVAVACGVKVERFSIGFGKTLLRWRPKGSETEFVLAVLPLGGYVKMLDEREAPVAEIERHRAFNNQPLKVRAAIVAAGPLANLLLAVLLYAVVNWVGLEVPTAVLAEPAPQSIAAQAGLQSGDQVLRLGREGQALQSIQSFEELYWGITQAALDQHNIQLEIRPMGAVESTPQLHLLRLENLDTSKIDADFYSKIGLVGPWTQAIIRSVLPDSAAAAAGLQAGDLILKAADQPIYDGRQLHAFVRSSISGTPQLWQLERAGKSLELMLTPAVLTDKEVTIGRIGAGIGSMPAMQLVRYGVWDGFSRGVVKTWEMSWLTLKLMGRMVLGQASLKNLSGPLTIADYAGKSASMGLIAYVLFLAAISVSLGVLNLLPLPVLDGGHLMYYAWEAITGNGVSERWMERFQRGGIAVLLLMMSIAFVNDFVRFFG